MFIVCSLLLLRLLFHRGVQAVSIVANRCAGVLMSGTTHRQTRSGAQRPNPRSISSRNGCVEKGSQKASVMCSRVFFYRSSKCPPLPPLGLANPTNAPAHV